MAESQGKKGGRANDPHSPGFKEAQGRRSPPRSGNEMDQSPPRARLRMDPLMALKGGEAKCLATVTSGSSRPSLLEMASPVSGLKEAVTHPAESPGPSASLFLLSPPPENDGIGRRERIGHEGRDQSGKKGGGKGEARRRPPGPRGRRKAARKEGLLQREKRKAPPTAAAHPRTPPPEKVVGSAAGKLERRVRTGGRGARRSLPRRLPPTGALTHRLS